MNAGTDIQNAMMLAQSAPMRAPKAAMTAGAQAPDRIATTTDGLIANSLFFNGHRVAVRHCRHHGQEAVARPMLFAIFPFGSIDDGPILRRGL